MNRHLDLLQPYPFQRFNELLEGVVSNSNAQQVAWSMGEPRHPAADFLIDAMSDQNLIREGYAAYPPTKGLPELRIAIASFLQNRFNLRTCPDEDSQVLPVNGTREALFAFAQTVLDPVDPGITVMPNPFYQIYEGACLLAGSQPYFLNCTSENSFVPDFDAVPADVWRACGLLYICTPGNPTGAVMSMAQLKQLIELAHRFDFVIASDECYSEIYRDENSPPPGILQAADELGNEGYKNCVAFNSLSKRSNLPGLRSGFVAGDSELLSRFLLYRTYHGSAMPVHHQRISALAWQDEQHVIRNRAIYRSKFTAVTEILEPVWANPIPEAGFYLWPQTPVADDEFAVRLIELANVKVLPGSYLSRDTAAGNPGTNRVRMALVATEEECVDAAYRIANCWEMLAR